MSTPISIYRRHKNRFVFCGMMITQNNNRKNKMLTVKIIRDTEVYILQGDTVTVLDDNNGQDELKAHICDCEIKSANIGKEVYHGDMRAVIFTVELRLTCTLMTRFTSQAKAVALFIKESIKSQRKENKI